MTNLPSGVYYLKNITYEICEFSTYLVIKRYYCIKINFYNFILKTNNLL